MLEAKPYATSKQVVWGKAYKEAISKANHAPAGVDGQLIEAFEA